MTLKLDGFVRKSKVIKIGTKDWKFTEISLADLAEFKGFLTEQRKKINDERRARLIEDAGKIENIDAMELLKLTDSAISEEELEDEMETIAGLGFLAYLSLRYAHTGIDQEQAMQIVTPGHIDEITEAMFPNPEKRPDAPGSKKKGTKEKTSRSQQQ